MKPPPIIRGPSWHKEMEEAVYPRVMDVNKGDTPCVRDFMSPTAMTFGGGGAGGGTTVAGWSEKRENEVREWERKGGLKRGLGRFFGGGRERGMDASGVVGGRRSVAAR